MKHLKEKEQNHPVSRNIVSKHKLIQCSKTCNVIYKKILNFPELHMVVKKKKNPQNQTTKNINHKCAYGTFLDIEKHQVKA